MGVPPPPGIQLRLKAMSSASLLGVLKISLKIEYMAPFRYVAAIQYRQYECKPIPLTSPDHMNILMTFADITYQALRMLLSSQTLLIKCSPQFVSDVIMATAVQSIHVHTSFKELHFNIFNFFSTSWLLLLENSQDLVVDGQCTKNRFLGMKTIWSITSFKYKQRTA